MNLFDKNKGSVHKIVNGVLLIWVLTSLILVCSGVVNNFVLNEKGATYEEYKIDNCTTYNSVEEKEVSLSDKTCREKFEKENYNEKLYEYQSLAASIISLVFSLGTLVIINRKK